MSADPTRAPLSFLPRRRGDLHRVVGAEDGFVVPIRDFAFQVVSGRIAAMRVPAPATAAGEGVISAIFATPLPDGTVRIPPARSAGWLRGEPGAGVVWAERCRGNQVLDCTGTERGRINGLVVEHRSQCVHALLVEGGGRIAMSDALFLADGRVLVESGALVHGRTASWLRWQDDIECNRMWWAGKLYAPPPLPPSAGVDGIAALAR